MISTTVGTLAVPGARLHYEVRGSGPLVALVGAPMNAEAFAPLAEELAGGHTVLTADPRGSHRSVLDDSGQETTPELRADDLARLLTVLDAGPAAVLGSSGGAVTALALAQSRPELLHTVVAHEPPLEGLLPDRDELFAQTDAIIATRLAGDVLGAWEGFLAKADIALPSEVVAQVFGPDREERQLADELRWFAHELRATTRWSPDLELLRNSPVRLVVGIGVDSTGQICDRTSRALAEELGTDPVPFPGDHTGFVDHPGEFAAALAAFTRR